MLLMQAELLVAAWVLEASDELLPTSGGKLDRVLLAMKEDFLQDWKLTSVSTRLGLRRNGADLEKIKAIGKELVKRLREERDA
jgi:hypothetical protein